MKIKTQQAASAVLMVRPTSFGFDEQTAQTNTFQNQVALATKQVTKLAIEEFDAAVAVLRSHGIQVMVFEDQDELPKPNAVFPNNWLSMWPDGQLYLYPMATESRRVERSPRALDLLKLSFGVKEVTDISVSEQSERYLESTGVMIFDHHKRLVYACISPRCDEQLFRSHAAELGYEPVIFHAYDEQGTAVYHTNVLMGIQSTTAVICSEAITDPGERANVLGHLEQTGHAVVAITQAQMHSFCGNVLELQNNEGQRFLAMSETAYKGFTPAQRALLQQDKTIVPLAIPTIETIGGGSVRCMLAEIFLPAKASLQSSRPGVPSAATATVAI